MVGSARWGYFRIITGTILGGILGFYVMHRTELHYKEIWNERLKKYEEELNRKKDKRNQLDQDYDCKSAFMTHEIEGETNEEEEKGTILIFVYLTHIIFILFMDTFLVRPFMLVSNCDECIESLIILEFIVVMKDRFS